MAWREGRVGDRCKQRDVWEINKDASSSLSGSKNCGGMLPIVATDACVGVAFASSGGVLVFFVALCSKFFVVIVKPIFFCRLEPNDAGSKGVVSSLLGSVGVSSRLCSRVYLLEPQLCGMIEGVNHTLSIPSICQGSLFGSEVQDHSLAGGGMSHCVGLPQCATDTEFRSILYRVVAHLVVVIFLLVFLLVLLLE